MKLTTEQIRELAPDWASHYQAYDDGEVLFEGSRSYQWYRESVLRRKVKQLSSGISKNSTPIPRKLPNNTAVLRSEVKTQADLDAMVKVAKFNGFNMSEQHKYPIDRYERAYIGTYAKTRCLQSYNESNEDFRIITLKEFLSYGEQPMQFADESGLKPKEERPMPSVKPPKIVEADSLTPLKTRPPIDQIADIMRRENITSINLSMLSDGKVTGSFDVESGV